MEIRPSRLAPDTQYCLDSAVDEDSINAFDYATLNLFGEQKIIDDILERARSRDGRPFRLNRFIRSVDMDAYAHELARSLPLADQRALFAFGLSGERKHVVRIADWMAHSNYEDTITGGCLVPYRKNFRMNMRTFEPTKGALRKLHARSSIDRYVKVVDDDMMELAAHLARGLRQMPWPDSIDEALPVFEWFDAQKGAIELRHRAAVRTLLSEHKLLPTTRTIKRNRKKIVRAVTTASTFFEPKEISTFVGGGPIEIRGSNIVIETTRRAPLLSMDHGALEVRLKTPEGERLCNLCIYFKQTPTLDQLVALKLHVDAGNEDEILKQGNMFDITPKGSAHPIVLTHHRPSRALGVADRGRAHLAAYKDRMLPVYIESVVRQVWGRDGKKLVGYFDGFTAQTYASVSQIGGVP